MAQHSLFSLDPKFTDRATVEILLDLRITKTEAGFNWELYAWNYNLSGLDLVFTV